MQQNKQTSKKFVKINKQTKRYYATPNTFNILCMGSTYRGEVAMSVRRELRDRQTDRGRERRRQRDRDRQTDRDRDRQILSEGGGGATDRPAETAGWSVEHNRHIRLTFVIFQRSSNKAHIVLVMKTIETIHFVSTSVPCRKINKRQHKFTLRWENRSMRLPQNMLLSLFLQK